MLLLVVSTASAQWNLRPSYSNVEAWHRYGNGVFCRCAHGAFVVDGEIVTFHKNNGLSSAYITASCADAGGRFWLLGYIDGNVDIAVGNRIRTIASPALGKSPVTDISCDGSIAVFAVDNIAAFVDADKTEMYAFCKFDGPVSRVAIANGMVYASVGGSVHAISIDAPNLQDADSWHEADFQFDQMSDYDGATPAGMPEDSFAAFATAEGRLTSVGGYCTKVSRQGEESFPHPDGKSFTSVFHNPYNTAHYFLGSSDGIVYEYVDKQLKAQYYNQISAPVVSMDCTSEGDLFVLYASAETPVMVFDHSGKWHVATSFQSMKCSSQKQLMCINDNVVLVNNGGHGIFAVDLGGTPLDFSDDKTSVNHVISGNSRLGTEINCMALSMAGYLYVGTDKGVAYAMNPENAVGEGLNFIRPIITENSDRDGSYSQYLLSSKTVTSIAEDAACRKWIATKGAGVFVVNDDCEAEVMRFNERNSPLPSDTVYNIAIVQNTGEIFFHTACGLASYISDAQQSASTLDDVLIYPNPVRPNYDGEIHISGLESGSDVRITDVAGHLVYKGVADSGLLSWDGNNLSGRRCATGVYLIFVYNTESGDKTVKKLLIVR